MTESSRALNEFVAFLSSPDMYGSMSQAAMIMKWLIHGVVTILMIAGIIAICFIVLKVAADVLMLSGLADLLAGAGGEKLGQVGKNIQNFASASSGKGDVVAYIKEDAWKIILVLAFIGVLASGMLLPLAGQVAGAIGAGVDKILGIDPAGQIEDFNSQEFEEKMKYTRANDLKAQYDKYHSQLTTYADYIYDLGAKNVDGDDPTLEKYKQMYSVAAKRLKTIAVNGQGVTKELQVPSDYFKQHASDCNESFLMTEYNGACDLSL